MPDDSGRKPAFLNISEYDFCSLQLSIRVYCLLRRSEQTGFSESLNSGTRKQKEKRQ